MSSNMTQQARLTPAAELAAKNTASFPNESAAYREARNDLLTAEIELRRHLWRVAEQRRALPPGGEVIKDYRFVGKNGEVGLEDLFGNKQTLIVYSMMYGPKRKQGCPMCTAQLLMRSLISRHSACLSAFLARRRRAGCSRDYIKHRQRSPRTPRGKPCGSFGADYWLRSARLR